MDSLMNHKKQHWPDDESYQVQHYYQYHHNCEHKADRPIARWSWLAPLALALSIPAITALSECGYLARKGIAFGLMIDAVIVLLLSSAVLRYQQVNYFIGRQSSKHEWSCDLVVTSTAKVNTASLALVISSAIVLSVMRNFMLDSNESVRFYDHRLQYWLHLGLSGAMLVTLVGYGFCCVWIAGQLSHPQPFGSVERWPTAMACAASLGAISLMYCIAYELISLGGGGGGGANGQTSLSLGDIVRFIDASTAAQTMRTHALVLNGTEPNTTSNLTTLPIYTSSALVWHVLGTSFKLVATNSVALVFLSLSNRMRNVSGNVSSPSSSGLTCPTTAIGPNCNTSHRVENHLHNLI